MPEPPLVVRTAAGRRRNPCEKCIKTKSVAVKCVSHISEVGKIAGSPKNSLSYGALKESDFGAGLPKTLMNNAT
jgi:hypothetical protein